MEYPTWLRDIFTLMTATYGNLWTDQFLDEVTGEAIKRVWYFQLKDFEPTIIRQGILQAGKQYRFPPKPAEMLEILTYLKHRQRDEEHFKILQENRLIEAPPRLPPTREVLMAKLEMWRKLGMMSKIREIEDALAAMDLQEK